MTDSADNTTDTGEVDRLKAKVRELLAENRQGKDRIRELTEATTSQAARLIRYEVDGPVEQIINEVAMPGTQAAFLATLAQHVRFEAGDDGQLVMRDTQGQPVTLPAMPKTKGREVEREARATVEDVRALVDRPDLRGKFAAITVGSRASGGGAGDGSTTRVVQGQGQGQRAAAEQRPEPKLGLR